LAFKTPIIDGWESEAIGMKSIQVRGSYFEMGLEHARQVYRWRKSIRQRIETRLADAPDLAFSRSLLDELWSVLENRAGGLVEMMRGIAQGLDFPLDLIYRYITTAYARDCWRFASQGAPQELIPGDGCTVWAVAGNAALHGDSLLVKNRDYRVDHQRLQLVARMEPEHGYAYLCVTSAGVPGVFSSGINAAGLAVADTRVHTPDIGPGLPSYASMMAILEHQATVEAALDYLKSVPLMGGHTLALADAGGNLGVLEVGYHRQGLIRGNDGILVTTNHFVSPWLSNQWVEDEPLRRSGDTLRRRQVAETRLAAAHGHITPAWAKGLSADPEVARHVEPDWPFGTVSSAIYLPHKRRLLFRQGPPWMGRYQVYEL
jgi:isopenicillin-N N-acyltransferase-like protein